MIVFILPIFILKLQSGENVVLIKEKNVFVTKQGKRCYKISKRNKHNHFLFSKYSIFEMISFLQSGKKSDKKTMK